MSRRHTGPLRFIFWGTIHPHLWSTGVRAACIFGDVDCDGDPSVYSGTDGTVGDAPWVGEVDLSGSPFYGVCHQRPRFL